MRLPEKELKLFSTNIRMLNTIKHRFTYVFLQINPIKNENTNEFSEYF